MGLGRCSIIIHIHRRREKQGRGWKGQGKQGRENEQLLLLGLLFTLLTIAISSSGEGDELPRKNQKVILQFIDLIPSGTHLYLILLDLTWKPIHFMKVCQPSQVILAEPEGLNTIFLYMSLTDFLGEELSEFFLKTCHSP